MKASVTKIIKFETAHCLTDSYSKECQRVHGHSYRCEVTFEGDIDKNTGMIIDFKKIKELLNPVFEKFDHQCFDKKSFGENPTAENMATFIFNMVRDNCRLVTRVRLWETDTCYAEVGY
jgi:6-pyruvoyltetrahydropterin/6-carboxytetrahydropterin synthase